MMGKQSFFEWSNSPNLLIAPHIIMTKYTNTHTHTHLLYVYNLAIYKLIVLFALADLLVLQYDPLNGETESGRHTQYHFSPILITYINTNTILIPTS